MPLLIWCLTTEQVHIWKFFAEKELHGKETFVICSTGLFCGNKTCYSERTAESWEKAERKEKWGAKTLMSFCIMYCSIFCFFFFIFFLILTKHYKTKEKMECDRKRSMTEKPDHIGPIIGIDSKYSVSMLWMSQKMGG